MSLIFMKDGKKSSHGSSRERGERILLKYKRAFCSS
jgi:hypothetical protein